VTWHSDSKVYIGFSDQLLSFLQLVQKQTLSEVEWSFCRKFLKHSVDMTDCIDLLQWL